MSLMGRLGSRFDVWKMERTDLVAFQKRAGSIREYTI